jgi:hypothetical protein
MLRAWRLLAALALTLAYAKGRGPVGGSGTVRINELPLNLLLPPVPLDPDAPIISSTIDLFTVPPKPRAVLGYVSDKVGCTVRALTMRTHATPCNPMHRKVGCTVHSHASPCIPPMPPHATPCNLPLSQDWALNEFVCMIHASWRYLSRASSTKMDLFAFSHPRWANGPLSRLCTPVDLDEPFARYADVDSHCYVIFYPEPPSEIWHGYPFINNVHMFADERVRCVFVLVVGVCLC